MLIAQLVRFTPPGGDTVYCACDPFDGEMLTYFHLTITQVEDELSGLDKQWGLNLAVYAGESDVPARISDEESPESDGDGLVSYCAALSGS